MWTILKVFVEFDTILFLFWFFGCKACEILVPRLGIEPTPPALEGKVLTIGLPAMSWDQGFNQAYQTQGPHSE